MGDEVVYLLQGGPYCKIGRSRDVIKRLKEFQTSHPYRLTVIRTWQTDTAAVLERYLHRRFQSFKMSGEWFQFPPDELDLITKTEAWNIEPLNIEVIDRRRGPKQETKYIHPLALWRKAHHMTQQSLADATELTQGMIAHIENYRHIPVRESLERLRTYTGLPTDALVRGEKFLSEAPDFAYRANGTEPLC